MSKLPKIFILDTNIILHDNRSIYNFQENDLVIPIAVFEELDKFKKGNDIINYHAREFVRNIDQITNPNLYTEAGYHLGEKLGYLHISVNRPFSKELERVFKDDIQDHRILATALWYKENYPDRVVALVTKDANLRLKSKAIGVLAQTYLNDHVNEDVIRQTTKRVISVNNPDKYLLDKLLNAKNGIPIKEFTNIIPPCNQFYKFLLNNGKKHLGRYNASTKSIVKIEPKKAYKISPRNIEQIIALDTLLNPDIKLISLTGTSGTGKTILALAAALEQADLYDQIMLARPVIPLKNQEIGPLPGSEEAKIAPYMMPLYDNLAVIKKNFKGEEQANTINEMLKNEKLIVSPLAYIRGRSLSHTFFIIDEAQNLTPHEVKTIITRAGEGTKIVFTGDVYQIDQPYLDRWSNGLTHLSDKLFGENLFAHINLFNGERSELSNLAGKKL